MLGEKDEWTLEGFAIRKIGDLITKDRFGWVELQIDFQLKSYDVRPQVKVGIPVKYERGWTIEQVRDAAFSLAREALTQTTQLFTQHSLAELQALDDKLRTEDEQPLDLDAQIAALSKPH